MKARPLISAAILYVIGILLGRLVDVPLAPLFACATLFLLVAWFRPRVRGALELLIIFSGWIGLSIALSPMSPLDLRRILGDRTEFVTIAGVLEEAPSERLTTRQQITKIHTLAKVQCGAIKRGEAWARARGSIIVSTPGGVGTNFFAGLPIQVTGVIRPPPSAAAPGLFNYQTYLRWQGIHYQLQVEKPEDWVAAPANSGRIGAVDRFFRWGRITLARGLPEEDEALRLIWAMALGWMTALTGEVSEPFMRTGTLHIFAISGLHIALIAWLFVQVFRLFRVGRAAAGAFVIPLIWFYTAVTGWQSSAIRSTIMTSVIILAWAVARPADLLTSLAASAFLILVWEPQQLFQASFQLSFFVVLSMALLLPPIEKWMEKALAPDPFLPDELIPWPKKRLREAVNPILSSFAISFAASLGSLPLIAYYFSLFTPITLLANLVIVPLSSLTLICNVGSLVCGDWASSLGILFNYSAWVFMSLSIWLCEKLQAWPGAYFYVRQPAIVECVIYYCLVIGLFTGILWKRPARFYTAGFCGLLLAGYAFAAWHDSASVSITILPGPGGSILSSGTNRSQMVLFSPGDESTVQYVTKPFLHSLGISKLPSVVLASGETHRVAGMDLLGKNFDIQKIVTGPLSFRSAVYKTTVEHWENGNRCISVGRGEAVSAWTVLHPDTEDRFSRTADKALVLKGDVNGWRILNLSDLGRLGQRTLGQREFENLPSDIVVTSLPTEGEPLSESLLDAIQPKAIIVCSGEYPATSRPSKVLRERLAGRGLPVFYTHETGAVSLTLKPEKLMLRTMRGEKMEWRR